MSTVMFSTTERLAPRKNVPQGRTETPPQRRLTGTCRNLFGPVDHDELKRELASKLRQISERDQLRWNFNFGEGQPLKGDLKWEESPAEDCPEFYRETTVRRPFVDSPTAEKLSQTTPKCDGRPKMFLNQKKQTKCNRRKSSRQTVQKKRLTAMRITDFYGKRKKTDSVHKESRNTE